MTSEDRNPQPVEHDSTWGDGDLVVVTWAYQEPDGGVRQNSWTGRIVGERMGEGGTKPHRIEGAIVAVIERAAVRDGHPVYAPNPRLAVTDENTKALADVIGHCEFGELSEYGTAHAVLKYLNGETSEPVESPCGAKHPRNSTVIPCQRPAGHESWHYSTTGCAGGAMHWESEPVVTPQEPAPLPATMLQPARFDLTDSDVAPALPIDTEPIEGATYLGDQDNTVIERRNGEWWWRSGAKVGSLDALMPLSRVLVVATLPAPPPPEIEEPQSWGEKITDGKGREWLRARRSSDFPWNDGTGRYSAWQMLPSPRTSGWRSEA